MTRDELIEKLREIPLNDEVEIVINGRRREIEKVFRYDDVPKIAIEGVPTRFDY